MALARFGRQVKRQHGVCVKMTAVAILGLCFIFVWSMFSSPSTSVTVQRESFDDIAEPVASGTMVSKSKGNEFEKHDSNDHKKKVESDLKKKDEKKVNGSLPSPAHEHKSGKKNEKHVSNRKKDKDRPKVSSEVSKENQENQKQEESQGEEAEKETEEEEEVLVDGKEEGLDGEGEEKVEIEGDADVGESVDQQTEEVVENENEGKKRKIKGPVFDPKAHYSWKLCSTRSKHNYIPCIDVESGFTRLQSYRHGERTCPKAPPMCLVPLPHDGYDSPVRWPESNLKILYKNVAHPKLAAYMKNHNWLIKSEEYLMFPQNQSEFKGGVVHYLESIEECWMLDAQIQASWPLFLIRTPFARRRLPFPSGVFDAIHCGQCTIPWHSHEGKLLLEINRFLRPGGYFILSTKHDSIEAEEAMNTLTSSICWNVLAHKTDDVSEVGVKIYQKPDSNDIYTLRRRKNPPLCKEQENPDAAWYIPMKTCLHTIPSAIEQHGTEWPEEWPKRLETYPEWLNNKEKAIDDTKYWKNIVDKSYLTGMGIDWSTIRNVMDMKAIYGGFAAALLQQKIWVMNVVPIHAPDTLPFIFERGLVGIYHDWCEPFGTYPRSYDLLHADHFFSRLKNRCKHPVSIVVEMDRILRPGGWVIVRDKVEILDPFEAILRS
ncbi:hypothetical protein V6N11_003421 [Hibiscus sabdariffa]|uniref:Methyltransferase n=1 Tax=Hibiscus sabdariffa TaxID=183260 RepID=A0ABR2SDM1_9ROSI